MGPMMNIPPLNDDSKLVLRVLAERDMDGYTLMSKSGLDLARLEAAVRQLVPPGLLNVKGDVAGERMLKSYFMAPPNVMRFVLGV